MLNIQTPEASVAIITAAGLGSRFSQTLPKQYWFIDGDIVLRRIVSTFALCNVFSDVVCSVPKEYLFLSNAVIRSLKRNIKNNVGVHVVIGGEERQNSVYNALEYIATNLCINDNASILIHDAARYLCSEQLINKVLLRMNTTSKDAVIPYINTCDSVVFGNKYVDRTSIKLIQTPQAFKLGRIYQAHRKSKIDNAKFTDDGSMMQYYGYQIDFVYGEEINIKLTTS